MAKKTQILLVHGGMTFKNRKDYLHYLKIRKIKTYRKPMWESKLDKQLGKNFEIIRPRMPLSENAKYEDWKIHFERHIPHIKNGVILMGVSLGGIFLAKYLSENKFPKKILSTYLVAPPFDNTVSGEDLVGGFKLKSDLSKLEKSSKNLYLLFSKKDNVIPIDHARKYGAKLKNTIIIIYHNIKGHFGIQTFPEIVKMIKTDVKKAK